MPCHAMPYCYDAMMMMMMMMIDEKEGRKKS